MKEQLDTLKKWVATGQVKTARCRHHDDLLTLIGQMEVALHQPPVISSFCHHNGTYTTVTDLSGNKVCCKCKKPLAK